MFRKGQSFAQILLLIRGKFMDDYMNIYIHIYKYIYVYICIYIIYILPYPKISISLYWR
jgi:hypothetical protein